MINEHACSYNLVDKTMYFFHPRYFKWRNELPGIKLSLLIAEVIPYSKI